MPSRSQLVDQALRSALVLSNPAMTHARLPSCARTLKGPLSIGSKKMEFAGVGPKGSLMMNFSGNCNLFSQLDVSLRCPLRQLGSNLRGTGRFCLLFSQSIRILHRSFNLQVLHFDSENLLQATLTTN